jgi:hypothetical protein
MVTLPHGEPTVMAMLECATPSPLGWEVLRHLADGYVTLEEDESPARHASVGKPTVGDPAVVSGESGCTGLAGLLACMANDEPRKRRWAWPGFPHSCLQQRRRHRSRDLQTDRRQSAQRGCPMSDNPIDLLRRSFPSTRSIPTSCRAAMARLRSRIFALRGLRSAVSRCIALRRARTSDDRRHRARRRRRQIADVQRAYDTVSLATYDGDGLDQAKIDGKLVRARLLRYEGRRGGDDGRGGPRQGDESARRHTGRLRGRRGICVGFGTEDVVAAVQGRRGDRHRTQPSRTDRRASRLRLVRCACPGQGGAWLAAGTRRRRHRQGRQIPRRAGGL